MTKPNFRSTAALQYGVPISIILLAIMLIVVGVLPIFGIRDAQGEKIPLGIISFIPIGFLLFPLYKLSTSKFKRIEFFESQIIISGKENYSWNEVTSLFKIPFTTPPIYRIKFKTRQSGCYFGFTSKFYASLIVYSYDFTGFLDFANQKIPQQKPIT